MILIPMAMILAASTQAERPPDSAFLNAVGQPADIAQSAYQFQAGRKPDANPPESWIALMHYAGLPLNMPVDLRAPAIRQALLGLLWEEIRPVQTLELTWPASAKHRPSPDSLAVTALVNHGASSSWWNNLDAVPESVPPVVSNGGRTYTYPLGLNTCGLVVAVKGDQDASHFDVPRAHAYVPFAWKSMNIEIEWGFEPANAGKDFSGHIEAYDGRLAGLASIGRDAKITDGSAWHSTGKSVSRHGIKLSLLYIGTSKWRKEQPYTTQWDDVARTIVTVWTKSGSFSFLAADLEHGPIYAPEYGFFVRRTSPLAKQPEGAPDMILNLFTTKMDDVAGNREIRAWGSNDTPWFGSNPTSTPQEAQGITLPAKSVAMHPGQSVDVVAEWRSPIQGMVEIKVGVAHAQAGGNGIEWWLAHDTVGPRTSQDPIPIGTPFGRDLQASRHILGHGTTDGIAGRTLDTDGKIVAVAPGDSILLIIGPKGDHRCDTTLLDWTISEVGGQHRVWNLAKDVAEDPQKANPHDDSLGNSGVWRFGSEMPMFEPDQPSDPPISLASNARSAKAFLKELKKRNLKTIREMTRSHSEQTWEGAVTATRGTNLPPIPGPPAGSEPKMQVSVPSERLTAQWNLGAWHLVRHCATNPQTGKLWFNDYPYGILAAETYLVLAVLDDMGSHEAAADGFDQWLMLPLERDHPVGLFADGNGALTGADGPDGYGGNMDHIHSFGPGSIGWALTQHYWLTGDKAWLKANEPRMLANAEWMLRQRQVVAHMVPGGQRLWCKGLQPALQVTPDSGGLWMQFYECEAYYWASVSRLAETIAVVDPAAGAKLEKEAEAYRQDLKAAVERSIALSPVVPIRDGTYHSVVPFACYCRGLSAGAWGWQRDGSGTHVGPLYWDTVQTAAALISPAGLLSPQDVRVQGYLDVLEDRLLLENHNVGNRNWFDAGWQYQGGLERTPNMHLAADDIPVFLRSFLNCYAVDILPNDGYVFNEHAVHGPPDKIFEEAAFLERFRNLLVMEDGQNLWLARGTPRAWLEQGKRISVKNAPTRFGTTSYEIVSDVSHSRITAKVTLPSRNPAKIVYLRLRHPKGSRLAEVFVNGKGWMDFDPAEEVVRLHGLSGEVSVEARY